MRDQDVSEIKMFFMNHYKDLSSYISGADTEIEDLIPPAFKILPFLKLFFFPSKLVRTIFFTNIQTMYNI